jgi:hypothetical protein
MSPICVERLSRSIARLPLSFAIEVGKTSQYGDLRKSFFHERDRRAVSRYFRGGIAASQEPSQL